MTTIKRGTLISLFVTAFATALGVVACRWQNPDPTRATTNSTGNGAGGYTAQCSGDFPDWIALNSPPQTGDANSHEPGNQQAFQLAQAYPLGIPVFKTVGGSPVVDHWDPPGANQDAPWRSVTSFATQANRDAYLSAIKNYILQDMSDPSIAFDAVKNNNAGHRLWFHVPMMTAAGAKRREPYHGVTSERMLRASEQPNWLASGSSNNLRAVAVGYYNFLGGYTIGQVFPSYNLSKSDATKGKFIDGTLVFKLLFAEYAPAHFKAGVDPLLHAPAWWVQDVSSPSNMFEVRLLQVDIAVKDDHFPSTGWVFSTFVYDESLTASEPNPWRRLTPIGLQTGNDPSVSATITSALSETWISAGIPNAFDFTKHGGRAGRLVGPVDNPDSSCISCHSTAQVDPARVGNATAYQAASFIYPSSACTNTEQMNWFRNLPSGPGGAQPFGRSTGCTVNTSTTGLLSLDYSLQLQEGLAAVFGYNNGNPCAAAAEQHHNEVGDAEATNKRKRSLAKQRKMIVLAPETQLMGPAPDAAHSR